jgi:hypothetical protein
VHGGHDACEIRRRCGWRWKVELEFVIVGLVRLLFRLLVGYICIRKNLRKVHRISRGHRAPIRTIGREAAAFGRPFRKGAWSTSTSLGQSQWGFHECFMHIKCNATLAKFHFLHETLGERRKEFHHGETFGHSFTWVGNCVKPPLRHK